MKTLTAAFLLLALAPGAKALPSNRVQTDIEYGVAGGVSLRLDAGVPAGPGPFPIAILVHGGGWSSGDKRDVEFLGAALGDKFTWFSVNYRIAPQARYPGGIEDAEQAIRWVRAHAAEYKGDPQRIALIGYSAGGHLVSMVAERAAERPAAAKSPQVAAVVALAAPTDLLADVERRGGLSDSHKRLFDRQQVDDEVRGILRDASPINHVTAGLPPFLVIQGTADKFGQSVNFYAKLRASNVPADLMLIHGAPHDILQWEKLDPTYPAQIAAWLERAFAGRAQNESTVAADGSGDFRTVQEAVNAAPSHSRTRFTIHIKPGAYDEIVVVPAEKTWLALRGDDPATTIITGHLHTGTPFPPGKGPNGRATMITFDTPTVFVQATDFLAESITFENSAGNVGQAVALTIMGDRGVFRNCRFLGFQDTLLAQAGRQYFDHCYIAGATDFIFGGSTAFFDHCHIHATANGYLTAANTVKDQPIGYVFSQCQVTGAAGVQTFLGRPWRPYAATVFLDTEMSEVVRTAGWNNWSDPAREKTVRYAEYGSRGAGGLLKDRVAWARQLTAAEAASYSMEKVLGGSDGWDPRTGSVKTEVRVVAPMGPAQPAAIPPGKVLIATVNRGDSTAGLRLAYSLDGYKWEAVKHPLLSPAVGKHMSDVRIAQGHDGVFYAVWAGDPGSKGFGYASSRDLLEWSEPKFVDIMAKQNALDLVSPNIFYDDREKQFVVTWASTLAKNAIQAFQEEVENNPRVWYATTRDFQTFSDPQLLFDNNYAARDSVILKDGARYALLHSDNTFPVRSLRAAFSKNATGPWGPSLDAFAARFAEAPAAIQVEGEWWIYDFNAKTGAPGLLTTRDFLTFTDRSLNVSLPKEDRPGSVFMASFDLVKQVQSGSVSPARELTGTKIVLAGDSTVNDEGGWGIGFRASFGAPISVVNLARNGRSSKSFRDEGSWAKVLAEKPAYVLIQFGHNDVPGKGPDRETDAATTYRANMARYIDEARAANAVSILVTSIVRRNFDANGKIKPDSLVPYVEEVRKLCAEKNVPLIDLYSLTLAQAEKRGATGSEALDRRDAQGKLDTTHLAPIAQKEIGVMAASETARLVPALKPYLHDLILWRDAMRQQDEWYGSAEAVRVADNLLLYQHDNGGWDKNIDMAAPLGPLETATLEKEKHINLGHTTMDNDATWTQMQYLARVDAATKTPRFADAIRRGFNYVLEAQYPNGGWPQFYPLRDGYWDHITYNDDAMTGVMETLRLAAERKPGFEFLTDAERARASHAVDKGIEVILKTQVVVNGKLTAWCAQHDEHTLAPVQARSYEHISLSGAESVGVVEQLMAVEHPSPEVVRAIEAAIDWFRAVKITGLRVELKTASEMPRNFDRVVVDDAKAPPLWARFYEIGTNRPIFSGRDGVVHYRMSEIEQERRTGYRWYVDRPAKLLDEEFPAWKARISQQR
jgi:PelA/Pel-15E family pectate lyase